MKKVFMSFAVIAMMVAISACNNAAKKAAPAEEAEMECCGESADCDECGACTDSTCCADSVVVAE